MGKRYSVGIVGESQYQRPIRQLRAGDPLNLHHEFENPYDPNAIAVLTDDGSKIGYIPRDSWLTGVIVDEGRAVAARVKTIEGGDRRRPSLGVVIEVEIVGTRGSAEAAHRTGAAISKIVVTAQRRSLSNDGNVERRRTGRDPQRPDNFKAGLVLLGALVLLIAYCSSQSDDGPKSEARASNNSSAVTV